MVIPGSTSDLKSTQPLELVHYKYMRVQRARHNALSSSFDLINHVQ